MDFRDNIIYSIYIKDVIHDDQLKKFQRITLIIDKLFKKKNVPNLQNHITIEFVSDILKQYYLHNSIFCLKGTQA